MFNLPATTEPHPLLGGLALILIIGTIWKAVRECWPKPPRYRVDQMTIVRRER